MNDILNYKGYYASVHFSATDDVFFGKILGINDLVSFEGASVKELRTAFEEAVEDYLETCANMGKTPEKTYKGSFNVRVSSVLHKNAALMASTLNMTLNEFVKTALSYALLHKEDLDRAIKDNSTETELV
jgi:predicted HicB family RNase H-like nuclease